MCPYCNTNAEMIPVSTVWWIIGAVVMATFIVSWFLFHHLWFKKKSYPNFCQRFGYLIVWSGSWLQRLWYVILLILTSIYFFNNVDQCMDLTFSTEFNGKNVVFIFWLALLLLPLFEKFEILGFSFKSRQQAEVSAKAAHDAINNDRIMNSEELNQLHRNGGRNE